MTRLLATCLLWLGSSLLAEDLDIFLLVGQSNMAGRGTVEPQDKWVVDSILTFNKEGKWVPARDPLHWDKPSAGVGLGRSFAKEILKARPGRRIGLVPCAVGGSAIDSWVPGGWHEQTKSHPWDEAIKRAHLALKDGRLAGILWHQGEADASDKLAPAYAAKLASLVQRLRRELASPTAPFILGQIGFFADVPANEWMQMVDLAHRELPSKQRLCQYVSSEGLTHKGDRVHFDSASYRELGRRYAEAWLKTEAARLRPAQVKP
jgi:hypothetical protein